MRQPARTASQQRQACGDHCMRRRVEPQPLRQHHAQHLPCLGIIGQRLLHRAVDQPVQIDEPAQHLSGYGAGQRLVLEPADILCRRTERHVQRLAAAQGCIEQAKRSAARVDTGGLSHGRAPYPLLRNAASVLIWIV